MQALWGPQVSPSSQDFWCLCREESELCQGYSAGAAEIWERSTGSTGMAHMAHVFSPTAGVMFGFHSNDCCSLEDTTLTKAVFKYEGESLERVSLLKCVLKYVNFWNVHVEKWLNSVCLKGFQNDHLMVILLFGASLVAQLVKNPPTVWETWVLSLSWEDPLEKGMTTHTSIRAWRSLWTV